MTKSHRSESEGRISPARMTALFVLVIIGLSLICWAWTLRGGRPIHWFASLAGAILCFSLGYWTCFYLGKEREEKKVPGRLLEIFITTVGIGLVIAVVPIIIDHAHAPTPPPNEFFHNHDLVVLTGYSIEQSLASASKDSHFDPGVQSTLSAVKRDASKEFQDLSDQNVVRDHWPELLEENLIYFLGKDSPATLTMDRWSAFLDRLDARLALLPAPQHTELANYMQARFPEAIHEALKDDFSENGKAWAGMEILVQKNQRDFASKTDSMLPLTTFTIYHAVADDDRRTVRAGYGHVHENDPWLFSVRNWHSPHDYMLNITGDHDVHIFDLHGPDAMKNMKDGLLAWLVGPPPSETIIVFSSNKELESKEIESLTNSIKAIVAGHPMDIIPAGQDGSQVAWSNDGWHIIADEKGVMGGPALTQKSWPSEVSHELIVRDFTFTGRTVRVNPTAKAASAGNAAGAQ